MANLSFTQWQGTGSRQTFPIAFDYLDRTHVRVMVNNVATTPTWDDAHTIRISPAPASGTVVEARRITPRDTRMVDFVDGSVLSETDLDLSALQIFFIVQEAIDIAGGTLELLPGGAYGAGNRRITNLANPTSSTDAVTRGWAETAMSSQLAQAQTARAQAEAAAASAGSSATSAGSSATSAASYRDTAKTHRDAAEGFRNAAGTSATAAANSASSIGNAEATTTQNAASAAASASAASGSASTASTAAANAASYRDTAKTHRDAAEGFRNTAVASATAAATSEQNAATSADAASTKATAASASASTASTGAANAAVYRDAAKTFRDEAEGFRDSAGASATAAANSAAAAATWDPSSYYTGAFSDARYAAKAHSHVWGDIAGKPSTFPPDTHNHDSAYYTKTQVDSALSGKASASNNLTALAALSLAADRLPYSTGAGALSLATFTSFARSILDDTSGSAVWSTLGATGSATSTGMFKLPSGILVQWSPVNIAISSGIGSTNFNTTFPTNVFGVVATNVSTSTNFPVGIRNPSRTGFGLVAPSGITNIDIFYIAIGY